MEILKGIPVSAGFAIGEAFVLDSEEAVIPRRFISQREVEGEVARFHHAVETAKREIRELRDRVEKDLAAEAAPIFDAHVMILSDSSLHEEVLSRIRNNRFSAEYAVSRSLRKFEKAFQRMGDSYLAQRVTDLHDIERRLLNSLLGDTRQTLAQLTKQVVLVAHDLTPSQTAAIDKNKVLGFATDVGGMTGHTAIVARARELPAVVGLGTVITDVSMGDILIIDGNRGIVVVNPDSSTLEAYRSMATEFNTFEENIIGEKDLPAITQDGNAVNVYANIEFPEEVDSIANYGGGGVGLYRTEFLYVSSEVEPDEAAHFAAYGEALQNIGDMPMSIRTLDLGADKFFFHKTNSEGGSGVPMLNERNPQLGCRAIRYCLQNPKIFKQQLRAICRASALGDVRMMIPMVSCRDEVMQVRQMVGEVQEALSDEDIQFNPDMQIGIMVEVPSVALTIERFVDICDFFSIGTNDLTQYVIAADRTNEHVANIYRPGHPAVLKLIKMVIDCADKNGIPVSLCGEMAGNPTFVLFLLGLGLNTFSVSPPLIPEVKKLIRSVTMERAREVAAQTMSLGTSREVNAYLRNIAREYLPGWTFS